MKAFRFIAVAALFVVGLVTAATAAIERKTALIIGNGAYVHASPLANPVNDALAMEAKLQELGFETFTGYDLDKFGMEMLLRDFSRASRQSDVNIFFYAGHGMSVDGINYLVPIDAEFADETALDFEAVAVDFVTRQMSLSDAVNLVFLDACRDNPLSRSLSRSMGSTRSNSVSNGLAEMQVDNTGRGMAIAFATSPGEVALDGDGYNSPFTTALLRHLDAPNTDIAEVFTRVTGDVYAETESQQRPWLNVSLTGPVMLNPVETQPGAAETGGTAAVAASAGGGASSRLEEQKMLFDLARETQDVEDYKTYLQLFPEGVYARNARRMIDTLGGGAAPRDVSSGGTQLASAAGNSRSAAINEHAPLTLPVTATLRSLPSSQATEAALKLNRTLKGNIQARLNAAGQNVGGVDGQWGPKTRGGITAWQLANGLPATGYLNVAQYELLVSQTEGRFTPYTAPVPRATTTVRRSSNSGGTTRRQSSSSDELGAALLGAAIGAILAK